MKKIYRSFNAWIIFSMVLGIVVGYIFPKFGTDLKILADIFIKLIKIVIGPIIFITIVNGISGMGNMKQLGRIGGKAIIYFEIISTIALFFGLIAVNVFKPGVGTNQAVFHANNTAVDAVKSAGTTHHFSDFIMSIIPDSFVGAFTQGEMLPILFISILFGVALTSLGEKGKPIQIGLEKLSVVFFAILNMFIKFSPVAAFGAMAFTVGKFGLGSLLSLAKFTGILYLSMFLFVFLVFGAVARIYRFSLFHFIRHIKEELLLVFGIAASEPALPGLMDKLEKYGCSKSIVGLVVPSGYSFNMDGLCIYLAMGTMFIAQAYGVDLSLWQQLTLLGIMFLTSKGIAGVTGGAFIVLAGTVAAHPMIPVEGLALLFGIDRFIAGGRSVINVLGNGVAAVVIAKSEKQFTPEVNIIKHNNDHKKSS